MKRAITAVAISILAIPAFASASYAATPNPNQTFDAVAKTLPVAKSAQAFQKGTALPKSSQRLFYAQPSDKGDALSKAREIRTKGSLAAAATTANDAALTSVYFETDNNGVIKDRYAASSPEKVVDSKTGRTSFTWSANSDSVNLSWWKPDDRTPTWIISRNGKPIAKTTSTTFTDTSVDRSRDNDYSVESNVDGKTEKEKSTTKSTDAFRYGTEILKQPTSTLKKSIEDPAVASVTANSDVLPKNAALKASVAEGAAQFNYSSFIPDQYIKRPAICFPLSYKFFNGNNRGFRNSKNFNSTSLGFKGQNLGNLSYVSGKQHLDYTKNSVGPTKAYDANKKEIAHGQAGGSGMKTYLTVQNGQPRMIFKQSIANPLCKLAGVAQAPNIDVDMGVRVDLSGRAAVFGSHDGAPNHEMTYNLTNSKGRSYGCLYRFQYTDFTALAPPVDVHVDISSIPMNGKFPQDCAVRK